MIEKWALKTFDMRTKPLEHHYAGYTVCKITANFHHVKHRSQAALHNRCRFLLLLIFIALNGGNNVMPLFKHLAQKNLKTDNDNMTSY